MSTRRSLESRRGCLPEIRPDGRGVKFLIDIERVRDTPRLILRCDADGNVFASIERSGQLSPAGPVRAAGEL